MTVKFVDLKAQYESIKDEIDAGIQRVIETCGFVGGEEVKAFEREFAEYCRGGQDVDVFCAGVANGTDALYLTLRALGIGAGDEVITVANTFIATAESISQTGATPVFVDVLEDTMLIDPDAIERAITPRTRAIMPVHLYGQACEMDRIMDIARRHDLKVVEDACQAHGARFKGERVGTIGHAACFSFYPGKNLGAYGDGGAVVSTDEALIKRIKMIADHGRLEKYTHAMEGVNSRLDGIQAAILRAKLPHLDRWNETRRACAARYLSGLRDADLNLPTVHPDGESVWHLFVVRVADRAAVQAALKERDVETGVHYPVPLHQQPAYASKGMAAGSLPVTEKVAGELLSLPMHSELSELEVRRVIDALRAATASSAELTRAA